MRVCDEPKKLLLDLRAGLYTRKKEVQEAACARKKL
jgi:hypothetical protein